MRKFLFLLILLMAICLYQGGVSCEEEVAPLTKKMVVGVVEFDEKGDLGIPDAGKIVAEWLITYLGQSGKFDLKERVLLKKVLEEQRLGLSGVLDSETAAKIGEIYGVDAIITGSIIKFGQTISITGRLINTTTGSISRPVIVKTKYIERVEERVKSLAEMLAGEKLDRKPPRPPRPPRRPQVTPPLPPVPPSPPVPLPPRVGQPGIVVLGHLGLAGFKMGRLNNWIRRINSNLREWDSFEEFTEINGGLEIGGTLGIISKPVLLGVSLSLMGSGSSGNAEDYWDDDEYEGNITVSAVPVMGRVAILVPPKGPIKLFLDAGLGLCFGKIRFSGTRYYAYEMDTVEWDYTYRGTGLAFVFAGGLDIKLGKNAGFFGSLGYRLAKISEVKDEDGNVFVDYLSGDPIPLNFSGIILQGGLRFSF